MAIGGDLGLGFGSINFQGVLDKVINFAGIFVFLLILGGIVTAFILMRRKQTGKGEKFKIGWWEEVNNELAPGRMDIVEEVIIPGTTLRIFYNKSKNLWLPRFTRGITKNLFYVLITPTRQMVNFTLQTLSEDMKKVDLKYDHTDMIWAAENAREYIKRNYKDKAIKWWQAYQQTIAVAALILIMTFSFIIIIYFMRGIVEDIGAVAAQLGGLLEQTQLRSQTSGIVGAT